MNTAAPKPIGTPLSAKEFVFAEEYLTSLNKSGAARKAGAPMASCKVQGFEIYNRAHVKAYIEEKLKERAISSDEVIKLVAGIAETNPADYFRPVKKITYPTKTVSLKFVIAQHHEEILQEKMFAEKVELDEEELKAHKSKLKGIERKIAKLEIELARNPKATRVIDLPPKQVTVMELDINLVIADKEKGRIKKYKQNKDGTVEVEMYSALEAQEKLLRIHGRYEKDNSQKGVTLDIKVSKEEAQSINAALEDDV
jgi:phage terminase small subunit